MDLQGKERRMLPAPGPVAESASAVWCVWDSHGGGFSGSVVSQEGGDLSLVEAERQPIHRQLLTMTVNFHQVLDVDSRLQMSWLLLHAHRCRHTDTSYCTVQEVSFTLKALFKNKENSVVGF